MSAENLASDQRRSSMCKFVFAKLAIGTVGLIAYAGAPLTFALAHEGHQMQCTETGINALSADIQAMPDGEAKTTAMNEMAMAKQMSKHDMEGCMAQMHNAMEATEK
jgi:hypothetical protein